MFYFNFEQNSKKLLKTSSGVEKMAATAQSKFHYITCTGEFKQHKDDVGEVIEFTQFDNLTSFAENNPAVFGEAADLYERKNGRVCASFVVALLMSLLDVLSFLIAVPSITIQGLFQQPHLHFMYSERSIQEVLSVL